MMFMTGTRLVLLCFCLTFYLLSSRPVQAHVGNQPRVLHFVAHNGGLELYINYLLPKSGMLRFWERLFDRNRNRRLESREQLALGKYILKRKGLLEGASFRWNGALLRWKFKEIQNSRLRGNARQRSYAWDIRFSAQLPAWTSGTYALKVKIPIRSKKEKLPIAGVVLGKSLRFMKSRTSALLRRKTRAVCSLHKGQSSCLFLLRYNALSSSTKPATRPVKSR